MDREREREREGGTERERERERLWLLPVKRKIYKRYNQLNPTKTERSTPPTHKTTKDKLSTISSVSISSSTQKYSCRTPPSSTLVSHTHTHTSTYTLSHRHEGGECEQRADACLWTWRQRLHPSEYSDVIALHLLPSSSLPLISFPPCPLCSFSSSDTNNVTQVLVVRSFLLIPG